MNNRMNTFAMLQLRSPAMFVNQPNRQFFGSKKSEQDTKEEKKPDEEKETKDEPKQEQDEKKAANNDENNDAAEKKNEKDAKKSESSESSSSSSDDELSKEDVAKIKQLFAEQEEEIEELKKKLEKVDKQFKVCRIELTNQVNENKATVTRYRKMIDDEKQFAITKFAKELLSVRDAVRMALENTDMDKINEIEDVKQV